MTRRTAVATAIVTAAALAGAAPIVAQTHPGGTTVATENAVAINDAGYAPATIVVAPGQHVLWTNGGINPHTVTADDAISFDSGTLQPKAKFDLAAPATPGTFAYHCTFHAFMHGTVVVSTLSLEGPKLVLVGKAATLHGASPGTAAGTPVVVEAFASGIFTQIASTTVAADGTFTVTTPALTTTMALRARTGETISPSLDIPVAPRVTAKRAGKRTLAVTVRPARAWKARLERQKPGTSRWVTVRQVRTAATGRVKVEVPKAGRFRVTVPAAKGLSEANSETVAFR
jgi:plastocyanin